MMMMMMMVLQPYIVSSVIVNLLVSYSWGCALGVPCRCIS